MEKWHRTLNQFTSLPVYQSRGKRIYIASWSSKRKAISLASGILLNFHQVLLFGTSLMEWYPQKIDQIMAFLSIYHHGIPLPVEISLMVKDYLHVWFHSPTSLSFAIWTEIILLKF